MARKTQLFLNHIQINVNIITNIYFDFFHCHYLTPCNILTSSVSIFRGIKTNHKPNSHPQAHISGNIYEK